MFDKKFDAIILNFVLEHIRDPFNFLNIIITNFLTPGGYILIEIPNDFNLLQTVYLDNYNANNKLPYWIHFPDHLNYWNCFTIIDFIKKFNLEVIYKRISFPMELFLLFGDDYIKEPKLGPLIHEKRVNFENSFHDANFSNTLSNIYETLFQFNVGRSIELVLNQKKNNNENNI